MDMEDVMNNNNDTNSNGTSSLFGTYCFNASAFAPSNDSAAADMFNNASYANELCIPDGVEGSSYNIPDWRQAIWVVLFVVMATVATSGNLIVIWIVLSQQRMRTVTNYFIVNLSIADTMVSLLNVTFNFYYMLTGHWPFGFLYCKISTFISVLSICGSVFTMVAISVDRCHAIKRPLRPRLMSRHTTILVAVFIWLAGSVIALPSLLYYTTQVQGDMVMCVPVYPDTNYEAVPPSNAEFIYNVFLCILTYVLPLSAMSVIYTVIGVELWMSGPIGNTTQGQDCNQKAKRRVVKMMMMVVIIFAICWLPQNVYFIAASIYPEIGFYKHIQEIYLSIYWLAMSNAMYNPMIYCFMNNRFRQGFLNVFYCFIRRPGAPSPPPTTADPNQQHYMMRQMRANSNANVLTTDLGTNNLNRSHLNLLSTMTSASAASSSSRLTQNGGRRKSSTDPSRFPLLPPSDNNGIQRVPLEESNNTNRGLDLTVEGVKGKTGQTFL